MSLWVSDSPDYPLMPTIEELGLPQEDGEIPKEKRLAYYRATLEHSTYTYLADTGQSNHAAAVLATAPCERSVAILPHPVREPQIYGVMGRGSTPVFSRLCKTGVRGR